MIGSSGSMPIETVVQEMYGKVVKGMGRIERLHMPHLICFWWIRRAG
jgi:hypothetical protein